MVHDGTGGTKVCLPFVRPDGAGPSTIGSRMDQAFLASFLIGLREGLEATLVVSILVAYLVKSGRRRELLPLWGGVAVAVALSVIFGGLLTYTETSLLADYRSRELFEAVASVLAVVLVTWMIFWMRRTARRLKGELTGRLETAVGAGALAVAGIAFVSVIREGLETALLFYAAAQGPPRPRPRWSRSPSASSPRSSSARGSTPARSG